jgi:hypothetical protein
MQKVRQDFLDAIGDSDLAGYQLHAALLAGDLRGAVRRWNAALGLGDALRFGIPIIGTNWYLTTARCSERCTRMIGACIWFRSKIATGYLYRQKSKVTPLLRGMLRRRGMC